MLCCERAFVYAVAFERRKKSKIFPFFECLFVLLEENVKGEI